MARTLEQGRAQEKRKGPTDININSSKRGLDDFIAYSVRKFFNHCFRLIVFDNGKRVSLAVVACLD